MKSLHITMMTIAAQAAYNKAVAEARSADAVYMNYHRDPGCYSKREIEEIIHTHFDADQRLADIEHFAETH